MFVSVPPSPRALEGRGGEAGRGAISSLLNLGHAMSPLLLANSSYTQLLASTNTQKENILSDCSLCQIRKIATK